jgi:hypothetical protein
MMNLQKGDRMRQSSMLLHDACYYKASKPFMHNPMSQYVSLVRLT